MPILKHLRNLRSRRFSWHNALFVLPLLLTISLLISSCSKSPTEQPAGTPSDTPPPPTQPLPTSTPIQPYAIILASPDSIYLQSINNVLVDKTQSIGWGLEIHPEPNLSPRAGLKLVIALPPDPGLAELTAEFPETQFIAIGIPGLLESSNLSIIGPEGFRNDRLTFFGGFLASVIAPQWRVGLISSSTEPANVESFVNGVTYYCGLCNPTRPPYYNYPIIQPIENSSSPDEWNAAVSLMETTAVEAIFLYSEDQVQIEATDYLLTDRFLFGNQTPAENLLTTWAATVRLAPEIVLEERWDAISNSLGGWTAEIPVSMEHINPELVSLGRQNWVKETLEQLNNGRILPLIPGS